MGFWTPVEFDEDKIIGEISGKILSGIWCLVRLKKDKFGKGEGKKKNWLFFKKKS